ncbi:MAG TPA: hypothetical protein VGF99_03000 [Myxococcota bacterium]
MAMGRVLQFRRPEVTTPTTAASGTIPSTEAPTQQTSTSSPAAVFDTTAGQASTIAMPVEGAALSQLVARLRASSSDQARVAAAGPVVVKTAEGPVLSGSVTIESRQALHDLDGVVRVGGSLSVEGSIKNADLLALRDVKVVEGRLTFESLKSL